MRIKMQTTLLAITVYLMVGGFGLGFAGPAQTQEITSELEPLIEHVTSYRFLVRGIEATESGNAGLAHDSFVRAARDANKIAQFKLGLMYLEGYRGSSDPERAWAWLELSAERDYPKFRELADQMWLTLNESEQATAQQILQEELRPTFGDEVAVPRVAAEMRRKFRRQTGSRAGYGGNVVRVVENSAMSGAASKTTHSSGGGGSILDGVTFTDGSVFYAEHKWDFEHIVAMETALFRNMGTVTIRDEEGDQ